MICSHWHTDLDHTAGLLFAAGLLNSCGVRTELGQEAQGFSEPYLRSVEAVLWQTWLPGGQDLTPGAGSLSWDWEGGEQGNWRCNQSIRSNGSHLFRSRGFSFCLVHCRLLGNQIWVSSSKIHEAGTNNVETWYWLLRSMQIHNDLRLFCFVLFFPNYGSYHFFLPICLPFPFCSSDQYPIISCCCWQTLTLLPNCPRQGRTTVSRRFNSQCQAPAKKI